MDTTAVSPFVEMLAQQATLPYSLLRDDVVMCVLLGCFLLFAILFADKSRSLQQTFRQHSIGHGRAGNEQPRTSRGDYVRALLLLFSCTSCALYILSGLHAEGIVTGPETAWRLLLQSLIGVTAYLLARTLLYVLINNIFFPRRQCAEWTRFCLDLFLFTGMVFYVLSFLAIFFGWGTKGIVIGGFAVVVLAEIWLIFNANRIFFAKKHGVSLEFVYLCALEWMPLLVLAKICLTQAALR